eukprot:355982-Chlamydomonas_euryale.AAC.10
MDLARLQGVSGSFKGRKGRKGPQGLKRMPALWRGEEIFECAATSEAFVIRTGRTPPEDGPAPIVHVRTHIPEHGSRFARGRGCPAETRRCRLLALAPRCPAGTKMREAAPSVDVTHSLDSLWVAASRSRRAGGRELRGG